MSGHTSPTYERVAIYVYICKRRDLTGTLTEGNNIYNTVINSTEICQAIVQGTKLLKKRKEESSTHAYPSVGTDPIRGDHGDVTPTPKSADTAASDHGNVVPTPPSMPRRGFGCAACNASLRAQSPKHTRIAGSCRFPHVESKPYKCPTCKEAENRYYNSRRNAEGHTYVDGECRYAPTPTQVGQPRTGQHPRDPRQPARDHPSSDISGYDASLQPSGEPQPVNPGGPSSSSTDQAIQPEEDTGPPGEARRIRGPDTIQRTRRTFTDKGQYASDEILPDWTRFNAQISLRQLRSRNPTVVRN